jgi:sugar transferase EpsL
MRSRMLKRLLDLAVASGGLVVGGPLIGLIALAVRSRVGTPILFRQRRPGLNGAPFEMLKFRTMANSLGPDGQLLSDAERLMPFGRWLRATSLDELPELWNVLVGEMSLVGPRPLLMEYLPRYSSEQSRRHQVKPGITGWAQINGRNALSWDEKFALDCWYVDNWSNGLDLRILLKTLTAVVRRDGISHDGDATMPKFTGARADL